MTTEISVLKLTLHGHLVGYLAWALKNLPMNEEHKQHLRDHWQRLHEDFRG